MNLQEYHERIDDEVIRPMLEFMQECGEDAEFSVADVENCRTILKNYIYTLDTLTDPDDDRIMDVVRQTVLALNELNERTDYALIETMEREAICMLVQDAAEECGLQAELDDVTEAWREW